MWSAFSSHRSVRQRATPPSLDVEGFRLYPHESAVRDLRDRAELEPIASRRSDNCCSQFPEPNIVTVTGPGILRFGERSKSPAPTTIPGRHASSTWMSVMRRRAPCMSAHCHRMDARLVAQRNTTSGERRPPPQDVPLAVCDARSLAADDFIAADAIFDQNGAVAFSFEALLLRHNPGRRWALLSICGPRRY